MALWAWTALAACLAGLGVAHVRWGRPATKSATEALRQLLRDLDEELVILEVTGAVASTLVTPTGGLLDASGLARGSVTVTHGDRADVVQVGQIRWVTDAAGKRYGPFWPPTPAAAREPRRPSTLRASTPD